VLYRVQVRRVLLKEERFGAGRADEPANDFAPVAAEIVYDDDIILAKRGELWLSATCRVTLSFN
jgi:hypothetical protein